MIMADVVLVQPKVGHMDSVRSRPALPLALLHAVTLIDKEYEIKLIDQRIDKDWARTLKDELKKKPLCVGITSMTGPQIGYALDTSNIVKRESDVPVVWGGLHSSFLPEQTLRNENIDMVVQGEGEVTFYKLIEALDGGKSLKGIPGLWYKEDGEIKNNPVRELLDLNELPDIPYHLIDVKKYMPRYMGKPTFYMQTSRGCPYDCTYCYNIIYNKRRWRALSSEETLERVRRVVNDYNPGNIYFVDDNFFIDLKRVEKILKGLIDIGINWQAQGVDIDGMDKMTDKHLRLLEESRCLRLTLGAESGSPRILNMLKKRHTMKQAIEVNKRLKDSGIILYYSFVVGFPEETEDELRQTVELALALLKDNPNARTSPVYIFTPYPGTDMFKLAVKNGYQPPETLEGWIDYSYDTANLPYPKEKRKKLESLYISSAFLDRKFHEYDVSPFIKLLAAIYRPIAKYRTRNLFFKFMIEKKVGKIFF
jgi:radical SAM superfamily enzyme YgiQ (UPF0313 family)